MLGFAMNLAPGSTLILILSHVADVWFTAQALTDDAAHWQPATAKRTGTYVGCMFADYMPLLRQGYGLHHTGAVMTGFLCRTWQAVAVQAVTEALERIRSRLTLGSSHHPGQKQAKDKVGAQWSLCCRTHIQRQRIMRRP